MMRMINSIIDWLVWGLGWGLAAFAVLIFLGIITRYVTRVVLHTIKDVKNEENENGTT